MTFAVLTKSILDLYTCQSTLTLPSMTAQSVSARLLVGSTRGAGDSVIIQKYSCHPKTGSACTWNFMAGSPGIILTKAKILKD